MKKEKRKKERNHSWRDHNAIGMWMEREVSITLTFRTCKGVQAWTVYSNKDGFLLLFCLK